MEEIKLNDIAEDLLIVNRYTIEKLFELDNCADCVALYMFYYKTAKWQKTNQIKANDTYVKQCLKWGAEKIKKTKQTLKENGLIEIVQKRENKKIAGWYVKIHYLISQKKIEDTKITVENVANTNVDGIENKKKQQLLKPTSRLQNTNTLRINNKYLKNKLNQIKLDNLFNNIIKEKPNEKELKDVNVQKEDIKPLQNILHKIDILIPEPLLEHFRWEKLQENKIMTWVVKELYKSEYKVCIDVLTYKKINYYYLKTKKYISETNLGKFVSYMIRCIQNKFDETLMLTSSD